MSSMQKSAMALRVIEPRNSWLLFRRIADFANISTRIWHVRVSVRAGSISGPSPSY